MWQLSYTLLIRTAISDIAITTSWFSREISLTFLVISVLFSLYSYLYDFHVSIAVFTQFIRPIRTERWVAYASAEIWALSVVLFVVSWSDCWRRLTAGSDRPNRSERWANALIRWRSMAAFKTDHLDRIVCARTCDIVIFDDRCCSCQSIID